MSGSGTLRVVPDANRVAAALIRPGGWSWQQLQRDDVRFFAPVYLWDELDVHRDAFAQKAGCSVKAWRRRVARLRSIVAAVAEADLLAALDDPLVEAAMDVDPDDAPYLAAFVAADAHFLWTNDAALWGAFRSIAVRLIPDMDQ